MTNLVPHFASIILMHIKELKAWKVILMWSIFTSNETFANNISSVGYKKQHKIVVQVRQCIWQKDSSLNNDATISLTHAFS